MHPAFLPTLVRARGAIETCLPCTTASPQPHKRLSPTAARLLSPTEAVLEAAESALDDDDPLFVEYTGLMTWEAEAFIAWHRDDGRDYLRYGLLSIPSTRVWRRVRSVEGALLIASPGWFDVFLQAEARERCCVPR